MACKFEYNGRWYEEADLKEMFYDIKTPEERTHTLSDEEIKDINWSKQRTQFLLSIPIRQAQQTFEALPDKARMSILSTAENLVANRPLKYLSVMEKGGVYVRMEELIKDIRKELGEQIIPKKAQEEADAYFKQISNVDVSQQVNNWKKVLNNRLEYDEQTVDNLQLYIDSKKEYNASDLFKQLTNTSLYVEGKDIHFSIPLKGANGNTYNFRFINGKLETIYKQITSKGKFGVSINHEIVEDEDEQIAANIALSNFKKDRARIERAIDVLLIKPLKDSAERTKEQLKEDIAAKIKEEEVSMAMEQFSPNDILNFGVENLVKNTLIYNNIIDEDNHLAKDFGITSEELLSANNNEAYRDLKAKKELINKIISNKEQYNTELDQWETDDGDMLAPMPGWWVNAFTVYSRGTLFTEIKGFFSGMVKTMIMFQAQEEYDKFHDEGKPPSFQKLLDTKNISNLLPNEIKYSKSIDLVSRQSQFNQLTGELESSKASPKTIEKVKEFLQRIGVDIKALDTTRYEGINGVAKLLENLVEIAQGKEDVALTEEAMHFAVEILKQTNSPLYKQMFNKIGSYAVFKDVMATYGQNPKYQINGKPNIIKLKEEAMGKVLAETFIKNEEGTTEKPALLEQAKTWLGQLLSWIQEKLNIAQFNPFEEAAKQVKEGNLGKGEIIAKSFAQRLNITGNGIFSQIVRQAIASGDAVGAISMIKDQLSDEGSYASTLATIGGDEALAKEIVASDFFSIPSNKAVDTLYDKYVEEDKNLVIVEQNTDDRHYTYKGKRTGPSVTEKISKDDKNWGEQTPEQIKYTAQTGMQGNNGHDFVANYITTNLIDANGYALPTPLDNPVVSPIAPGIQDKLKQYITELIASYPAGTRFLVEKKIINFKTKDYTPGTLDFMAIIPGPNNTIFKVDTLDWKFLNLNKDKNTDIPYYKNEKWNKQMAEYVGINRQYVKAEQIGKARMIPFVVAYNYNKTGDITSIKSIEIGDLDNAKETSLYLLPVPVETESTGNPKLDSLISKLRAQYKKLWNKRVDEKDKGAKLEQLNELAKAIRQLHLQINFVPLKDEAQTFMTSAKKVLDKYATTKFASLSTVEINNILKELIELENSATIYGDINDTFLDMFPKDNQTPEEAQLAKFFDALAQSTIRLIETIRNTQTRAAAGLAVQENTVFTDNEELAAKKLLTAEKEIGMFVGTFAEASKLPSRVIELAAKLWLNKKSAQYQQEKALGNQFAAILPDFLAATKGMKTPLDAIKQKGKHKLIYKVDIKFYDAVKKAYEAKDKKFLLENVDVDAYNKDVAQKIKTTSESIENTPHLTDEQKHDKIQQLRNSLELDQKSFNGWHNKTFQYYYRQHLKVENHISKEYLEMAKSPSLLKMWEFLSKLNEIGQASGYTNSKAFLPYVEGTIIEQLSQSVDKGSTIKKLLKQGYILNVNEKASHVKINKQTGEIERSIAKIFTSPSESLDSSAYSQDLTKLVGPWINAMLGYQSASEMEYIMLTLQEVEQSKGHLQIDPISKKVIFEQDAPKSFAGNEKNAAILQKIVDDDIYHLSESNDTFLGVLSIDNATNKLSKGTDEEKATQQLQTKKVLQRANTWTAMLATAGKLMVSIPNTVGNAMQAVINAGTFYNGLDYGKNVIKIMAGLSTIDKALIDVIHPLNEDTSTENTRKFAKKQSTASWLSTWSINDVMHSANRAGELIHEYTNAKMFNDNAMIVDGKIVSIRQHLKKQDAYRYTQSTEAERLALEKSFETRVKALQESSSLPKIAKFNTDGVLEIEGVSPEELARYRTKVAEYARNISGKISRDNKANWNRSVILRSFMMFKGWIPKQLDLRFSDTKFNNELGSWEYGRTRLFIKTWAHLGFARIAAMQDIIKGTDKGLAIMREILEEKRQKHLEATGQELEITEEEFFDMMRKELHSQSKELIMLVGVVSFFMAAKLAQPDDDDDALTQNRYKWWRKLLNKISNEIDFYYNPASADSITRGSIIPSLSILNKAQKALKALATEGYGHAADDQDLIDDTYPSKYFINLVPGAAQFQNDILPFIWPEGAKEMGVRVTEQVRQGN